MQFRLYIVVDGEELATEVYFKSEKYGELWLKHHYLLIAQLILLLKKTRDFETKIRRTL